MSADLGERAPEFTLQGIVNGERREFSLSEFRGAPLVIAFYPGDNTPGCTAQLCSYRDEFEEFRALDAAVVGISPQGVDSHEGFASKRSLPFPLLADTDLSVAAAYEVTAPLIKLRRSVFILDAQGVVRYKHVAVIGVTYRKPGELLEVLRSLGSASAH